MMRVELVPALALAAAAGLLPAARGTVGAAESSDGIQGRGYVAVKAGTIHTVEDGRSIQGGTVLLSGRRIAAVGRDVDVPADAEVVDYGPDAVIVPGLVAAHASFSHGAPSPWTADPGVRAIDGFDPWGRYDYHLAYGVTAAYLGPTDSRLIGGQGAVVKLAGEEPERRTLSRAAALHGAIHAGARETRGHWEPPVPATSDVELGYAKPQLPASTMGAIVALDELLGAARAGRAAEGYGPAAARDLARCLEEGLPWRIGARRASEIRAILDFAEREGLSLVVDEATEAGLVADEIARAGAAVVYRLPFQPGRGGVDRGKGKDDRWPSYDVPARLVEAGVRTAIASSGSPADLLFAAAAASRGGLSEEAALRAITLTPAEILGVEGRVGSLRPGKDADLVVLNGPPLSGNASVLATWVDGELAWRAEGSAVVISVEELHTGDGEVLGPAELLLSDGRITEVARRVSRPRGARVVSGFAAMPGMIDAFGHLGLQGAGKTPSADYSMSAIVAPGDEVDRRVARRGVTTVVLAPRGVSRGGSPVLAYKPAAAGFERQVVEDPAAIRLKWTQDDRLESGAEVRELLEKAVEYRQGWIDYEEALAEWEPAAAPAGGNGKDEEEDESEEEGEEEEAPEDGEESEPDPVTGVWRASVARPPRSEESPLAMRLLYEPVPGREGGEVTGNLRSAAVSDDLVPLEGWFDAEEARLTVSGVGSGGWVDVEAEVGDGKMTGEVSVGGDEIALEAERASTDVPVAARPQRREAKEEPSKPPKGKPKEPRRDDKLEPLRRAIDGEVAVVVEVDREDEILACVEAFEEAGIRPVLLGADGAHHVASEIAGRVAGVLLSQAMRVTEPREPGLRVRTPYADLQNAGVPVAFHSGAEEGAADLPLVALYAVANGMSPTGALRALTADAAAMLGIEGRVGRLERGLDADVLLLDGPPLAPGTSVLRVWVSGEEVAR